jgi:UrcA family protein
VDLTERHEIRRLASMSIRSVLGRTPDVPARPAQLQSGCETPPEEFEMNSKALLISAAAAFCLAGVAQAACAQTADRPPSLTVRTADLDLSSARDVQRLYERLYNAAMVTCGGGPMVYFFAGPPADYLACRNAALDDALSRFDAPRVVDLRARLQARPHMAAVMQ